MKKYALQIGVIGSAGPEEYDFEKPLAEMYKAAEELGRLVALCKAVIVTGGKGGIMESASKGAKRAGGITIAEIAGNVRGQANRYVDIEMVTGDVAFRGPSQLVGMCDGLVCLGGGAGTLQELCVAYRMRRPVVLLTGYGGWTDRIAALDFMDERRLIAFEQATSPEQAVEKLYNLLQSNLKEQN